MICTPKVGQLLEVHIFMSREKEFNTKYSPEFKIAVIMDMRENNLSYRETARKYGLVKRSMGGAMETLHRWERIYLGNSAQVGAHILGRRSGRTHGRTTRKKKRGQIEKTAIGKVCGRRSDIREPKAERTDTIS